MIAKIDIELFFNLKKIELIEEQIVQHKLHKDPEMAELYKKYEKKALVSQRTKNSV